MGVSKRAPVCLFCASDGIRFALVVNDDPRQPGEQLALLPRSLCRQHYSILEEAGPRGRVHKPTGKRWWLAAFRPRQ